ncbi:MAG: hypothetical protein NTY35_02075 [Planctomycetota bacterium]|nr:hypothetical protein [Planctomycetota bacterium]
MQVDGYRASGMARALGPLLPGELKDVLPARERSGSFAYRFELDGQGARVVESLVRTEGGREISRDIDSGPIVFAVGAGILDRSFVVRRGELMRFGPLEVVRDSSTGGPRAQLAPGHAITPGARWTIPIAEECLRCHTSSLPPRDHPYDLVPPADWQPTGIDCGTCHARSSQHADWQVSRNAGKPQAGSDPITSTSSARRVGFESCARCHLQGDALISIAAPLRGIPGPEADLFAARAVFVSARPSHEIGFVSHVERLALSACFRATRDREIGGLLCTTCHDPHRASTDPAERARARNACSKCHAAGDRGPEAPTACSLATTERQERACVDCHLRRTGVFDVAGVEIHDHRIERRPPPPSPRGTLRVKATRDGELARFAANGDHATNRDADPGLWLMAYLDLGRRDLAWSLAAREPGATADALASFHHLRASLREEHQDAAGAEADLRRALTIDPDQAESSINLGALLVGRKQEREAVEMLTRVLERHPRSEGALRNRGVAWLSLGQLDAAVRDLEAAQRIHPLAPIARLLAQVFQKQGQTDLARQWSERARALDPLGR